MMSSGALPNVALSRPPTASPVRCEMCSVASTISAATGMIAMQAAKKIQVCCSGRTRSSTAATGTKMNTQFIFTDDQPRSFSSAREHPRHREHHENDEKDQAKYRAHSPVIARGQVAAAVVHRARPRAIGRDDAHDAELEAQQQR